MNPAPDWVERGLPLVRPIAESLKRRLPDSIETDDLIGAGRLALVTLAREYSPDRGVPFEAWVKFRIRGAMIDSIKGAPFREAKHPPLTDVVAAAAASPEEGAVSASELRHARRALLCLPGQQRALLALLFGEGLSLRAASRKIGLSEAKARTARRDGIGRLRRFGRRLSCSAIAQALSQMAE